MQKSIYFKDITDVNYNSNRIEEIDPIEELISQIKMILYTNKGDVLGKPELGLDLERLLFEYNIDSGWIERDLYNQIQSFVSNEEGYPIEIQVDVITDNNQRMLRIDIIIAGVRRLTHII